MSVGPVNNGQGFAHQGNLPGNEGEPQAPRGDGPRNDRANGNGNIGNGNGGVHGNEGKGPRTGGNNPASVESGNQGNQGPQGNHGNPGNKGPQGNKGPPGSSRASGHPAKLTTGGPASPGLADSPGLGPPLGNRTFP